MLAQLRTVLSFESIGRVYLVKDGCLSFELSLELSSEEVGCLAVTYEVLEEMKG